jgi:serine protease Do
MRKRTVLAAVAVLLIALIAVSAYEFAGNNRPPAVVAVTSAAASGQASAGGAIAANQQGSQQAAPSASAQPTSVLQNVGPASSLLAAYEGTLEQIYAQVDPSVVNIQVIDTVASSGSSGLPQSGPFGQLVPQGPQVQQGLASGFVWDQAGHIVTNNHVVDGASQITVRFFDGTTVPAKVVGTDVNSDLAVIQVQAPAGELHPVQMADSRQLKVGQLVVAIGNPFGLQGSMSAGIVSALGRSLPVGNLNSQGPTYSIPDIIQTDAPINPGNSGGVLTNDEGQVIGVTAAIESPVGVSAGIGFAVPSAIVQKVVPVLIKSGHYNWPWLGLSGGDLDPSLAKAMGLNPNQRGALLGDVVAGGPADKAGLHGSSKQVSIQGQTVNVGGDVIIAVNGQPVNGFDDVVAYLSDNAEVGQTVNLTILRQGKEQTVAVTLAARPQQNSPQAQAQQAAAAGAYMGVTGVTLTPAIASAMGLSSNQKGILVEGVDQGSPAEQAGLQASGKSITINGQQMLVGGDVIVGIDGQRVTQAQDLQAFLDQSQPGQDAIVTVLRGGRQLEALLTLGDVPAVSTT